MDTERDAAALLKAAAGRRVSFDEAKAILRAENGASRVRWSRLLSAVKLAGGKVTSTYFDLPGGSLDTTHDLAGSSAGSATATSAETAATTGPSTRTESASTASPTTSSTMRLGAPGWEIPCPRCRMPLVNTPPGKPLLCSDPKCTWTAPSRYDPDGHPLDGPEGFSGTLEDYVRLPRIAGGVSGGFVDAETAAALKEQLAHRPGLRLEEGSTASEHAPGADPAPPVLPASRRSRYWPPVEGEAYEDDETVFGVIREVRADLVIVRRAGGHLDTVTREVWVRMKLRMRVIPDGPG